VCAEVSILAALYTQVTKYRAFSLVSPEVNFFILPGNTGIIFRVVSLRIYVCVCVCVCLRLCVNAYAYYVLKSVFRVIPKWKFAS
jgi:hypothetical protein